MNLFAIAETIRLRLDLERAFSLAQLQLFHSRRIASQATALTSRRHRCPSQVPSAVCYRLTRRAHSDADPETIDHLERLWDRGARSRPAQLRFFPKVGSDLSSKASARCRGECLLVRVKLNVRLDQSEQPSLTPADVNVSISRDGWARGGADAKRSDLGRTSWFSNNEQQSPRGLKASRDIACPEIDR